LESERNAEDVTARLEGELCRERAGRQASESRNAMEGRELADRISGLESQLKVRDLEVRELTALVGSLHAKIEQCTAVSVRATEEAKHGPGRPK
jgi:hypothetical protein